MNERPDSNENNQIDSKYFKHCVGREPELDDLDRCNCSKAGELCHMNCGWCHECNLPVFECGHIKINLNTIDSKTSFIHAYTNRGFPIIKFNDVYDKQCTIQLSSLAESPHIWIGQGDQRMHLNINQTKEIIKILQRFVDIGTIDEH
jgi:hypothetical protein